MSSNKSASTRILGALRSAGDGTGVVRMEDRFDTDIDDLWAAVTDPQRLARWYGEVEGDLRVGGEYRFRIPAALEGTGRVVACNPPHHLQVTDRDSDPQPGQPTETTTEVTLTADGDQTVMVIEQHGLPLNLLAAYGAGMQIHVENLAAHVAGHERGDDEARWGELLPGYESLAPDSD